MRRLPPLLVPISPVVPANAYVRDEDRVIAVRVGPEWIVVPGWFRSGSGGVLVRGDGAIGGPGRL